MTRTQDRANLGANLRRDLWVAAAGRCEFRGCSKPIDRDFLTKVRCNVSEYAHIIADSPAGARGVPGVSEKLAADPSNLMLLCYDCHARIDRGGQNNNYTTEQLRAMKREHEARIQLIYSATGVKNSLPILMSFPIGAHIPAIDINQVQHAILENSNYTRFPLERYIHIDRADFDHLDDSQDFWPMADKAVNSIYTQRILPELTSRDSPGHITVAALAPIPMLMKLGALLGDKTDAMVLDLPSGGWLWDKQDNCPEPLFSYTVPQNLPHEVAIGVSISNRVVKPNGMEFMEFMAKEPNRGIIRTEGHLQAFRREFNSFLMGLVRAGARVLHIHPATPLCVSVEIGRLLLPKTFEEIHVWEWQAPQWRFALRLK
jgi:SMODS-associated and fused to various effectors sensor domain